jgi:galactokinase/mevalonate kinase-like predicted kinase
MFSALPKGSGLGTSSVLGAALLACLGRVHGQSPEPRSLIRRTSLLEQMMSTAGGWQDQAGGILPGVKLLTTSPGRDQTPAVMPLPFDASPGSELAARTLLYYTGYRRLAADILHGVVGRYLARDRRVLGVIYRLKACAMEMKAALAAGDLDGFARGVLTNWELKKEIDPGSTNARIESLFAPLTKYLTGYELPGADGGGFLLMITRDEEATCKVRSILTRRPPNALARFYDVAVDLKGLSVSVL